MTITFHQYGKNGGRGAGESILLKSRKTECKESDHKSRYYWVPRSHLCSLIHSFFPQILVNFYMYYVPC